MNLKMKFIYIQLLDPGKLVKIVHSPNASGKTTMDIVQSSIRFINEYSVNKWEPDEETLSKRNMV